jgi:hypothetical protein
VTRNDNDDDDNNKNKNNNNNNKTTTTTTVRSWVSSVSIVSDYGLDDRAIGVRTPVGVKDYSSIRFVSTPALGPTQSPVQWVPEGKALLGRDADHSSPSSAEVMNEQELYLLSPQAPPLRVVGLLNFFLITVIGHYAPSQQ